MFECDNCLIKLKSKYLLERHKNKKVPCIKFCKNEGNNKVTNKPTKEKPIKNGEEKSIKKGKPTKKNKVKTVERKLSNNSKGNDEDDNKELNKEDIKDELSLANKKFKHDFEQELERNVELQELLKKILDDMAEEKLKCVFCEGMFNKNHIHAHYAKDCDKITDDLKKYFVNKCNLEHTYKDDEKPPIYHIKTLKYALLKQVFMDDTSSTDVITEDKLINISHNNRYIVQIE